MFETSAGLTVTPGVAHDAPTSSGMLKHVARSRGELRRTSHRLGRRSQSRGRAQLPDGLRARLRRPRHARRHRAFFRRRQVLHAERRLCERTGRCLACSRPTAAPAPPRRSGPRSPRSSTSSSGTRACPRLGYYTDLLYIADVIAPGSFNDIQLGNNINSFYTTAVPDRVLQPPPLRRQRARALRGADRPGLHRPPGFDLASGLGSPNGLLLARALTAIAHQQVSFSTSPAMLDSDGSGGWVAGASEALLFQAFSPEGDATVGMHVGNGTTSLVELGHRSPTPGRRGSPSSRCSPISIPPWCCCSTGRARARWATTTSRPARRSA